MNHLSKRIRIPEELQDWWWARLLCGPSPGQSCHGPLVGWYQCDGCTESLAVGEPVGCRCLQCSSRLYSVWVLLAPSLSLHSSGLCFISESSPKPLVSTSLIGHRMSISSSCMALPWSPLDFGIHLFPLSHPLLPADLPFISSEWLRPTSHWASFWCFQFKQILKRLHFHWQWEETTPIQGNTTAEA